MYSTSYTMRSRLERKFGIKFSVTTDVSYFGKKYVRIKWSGLPTALQVSLVLRDFRESKLYVHGVIHHTEEYKTPSQLRK